MSNHINLSKLPPYSLPKIYGWHMLTKQNIKDKGKIYQYFGANWWDLLLNDKLPLSTGKITIETKNTHSVILINLGNDTIQMDNKNTGDVYNILPGKRSIVNNTFDKKITLVSSKPKSKIHLTKIGSITIILLQVEQLKSGKSMIKNTEVFNDFLLMSGVPDKDQYLNTVGIESFDYFDVEGWKYLDTETAIKSEFTELLLEQWNKVNPSKRSSSPVGIPKVVQWIWVRKDVNKDEYGPLKPVFYKFMNTWIERNPGFEFNIWTDNPNFIVPKQFEGIINIKGPKDIEKLFNKLDKSVRSNIKYLFNNHGSPGARSDTLRQVILYYEGGIYADINDAACLVSMEKMMDKFDYIIGLEPVIYVNNAIIASKKKHPIGKAMISWLSHNAHDFVEEWKEDYKDESQDAKDDYIVSTTGPIAMTQAIFGVMKRKNPGLEHSLFLPSAWVYPNYWIAESPSVWLKPVSMFSHYDRRDYLKN